MTKIHDKTMFITFLKHILPAMLAYTFSGIYAIIDGLFIGNALGDAGLSAINLAYPITAFIFALGTGIGMASGVLISINHQDNDKIKRILGNTFIMLVVSLIVITITLQGNYPIILKMIGTSDNLMPLACEYMQVVIIGMGFYLIGSAISPITRNFGGNIITMIAMSVGFFANIFLDYIAIYIFNMGLKGAALATITSQALTTIICLAYLQKNGYLIGFMSFKIDFSIIKNITTTAIAPFGLSMSPNIIIAIMNIASFKYGQDRAIAVYAVISYIIYVAQLLIQGIADGTQPLISRAIGLNHLNIANGYLKILTIFTSIFSILLTIILFITRYSLPAIFGVSTIVANDIASTLSYFSLPLIFFAISRVITSYFYASKHNNYAFYIIYLEPLLVFILTLVLPLSLKLNGVWLANSLTLVIISLLAIILLLKTIKLQKSNAR